MKEYSQKLDNFLQKRFHSDYKKKKNKNRLVKFRIKDQYNVDVLVSQYFDSLQDFYKFLQSLPDNEDRKR